MAKFNKTIKNQRSKTANANTHNAKLNIYAGKIRKQKAVKATPETRTTLGSYRYIKINPLIS